MTNNNPTMHQGPTFSPSNDGVRNVMSNAPMRPIFPVETLVKRNNHVACIRISDGATYYYANVKAAAMDVANQTGVPLQRIKNYIYTAVKMKREYKGYMWRYVERTNLLAEIIS